MQVKFEIGVGLTECAYSIWQNEWGNGRNGSKMKRACQKRARTLHRLDKGMSIIDQGAGTLQRQFASMSQLCPTRFTIGEFYP